MRSIVNFSFGSPRIQRPALSSGVVAGYARFELPLERAARKDLILLLYAYRKNAAADLTPRQVSRLAKVVKEEFGSDKTDV
jgi:hypothetical protein